MIITIDDGDLRRALEEMKETIPEAGTAAARASLKEFAEKLRDRIREMIPDNGGWYDIYRESVQLIEINPDHYDLATDFHEVGFSRLEADSTVAFLSGGEVLAQVLAANFNPWTIDTIPAIKGGLQCDLIVKPGSESEVNHVRSTQLSQRKAVESMVKKIDSSKYVYPLDAELPHVKGRITGSMKADIRGRILADIPFLARRLEYGLGGFPRTPIWSRIEIEGKTIYESESVESAAEKAFNERWRRPKK